MRPYHPRPTRFLELWEQRGWRLKIYGITHGADTPRPQLVVTAKGLADRVLPDPPITAVRYGVGFIGVHDGAGANFVFVCWWANENELHHMVYCSEGDELEHLTEQPFDGAKACVWDIAVIGHERGAWIEAVLDNPAGPNLDAYLDLHLNEDV